MEENVSLQYQKKKEEKESLQYRKRRIGRCPNFNSPCLPAEKLYRRSGKMPTLQE
jgi:hypothetical protein